MRFCEERRGRKKKPAKMWGYEMVKRYESIRKHFKQSLTRDAKLWKIKLFIFKNFNIPPEEYPQFELTSSSVNSSSASTTSNDVGNHKMFNGGGLNHQHSWFELEPATKNKLRLGSFFPPPPNLFSHSNFLFPPVQE